jgi:predicted nucleic acid-binding protein
MKILDSTALIAVCANLNRPELITDFISEGYKIVVCDHVVNEIVKEPAKGLLAKLIKEGKANVSSEVSTKELEEFRAVHPQLGLGECSVILLGLKQKQTGQNYCCILDDGVARKKAQQLELKFTGTIGMLQKLVSKNKLTEAAYDDIIYKLKQSGFRFDMNIARLKGK